MTDDEPPEIVRRLATAAERVMWDYNGPLLVTMRFLGDPEVADAFATVPKLAAVAGLHTKRTWQDGVTVVCNRCNVAWPCEEATIIGLAS